MKKPKIVELPEQTYQPTKAELEEEFTVDGTFEEGLKALTEPVEIRRLSAEEWKRRK